MSPDLRNHLRGCLEVPVFLAQGVERFSGTKQAFLKSFLITLLLIPLTVPIAALNPDYANLSIFSIFVAVVYRTLIATAFLLGTIWMLCFYLDRKDRFYQFGTAYNWLGLSIYVLVLPFYVIVATGMFTWPEMMNLLIFIMLYSYVILGFMAKHVLKMNLFGALGVAILGMACDEIANALLMAH